MIDASLTVTAPAPPAAAASTAAPPAPASTQAAGQPGFFHDLLSELNPLQYVPVVGTIYRAVTGDTIPETARFAGSLVVSGLTGGPIGIGINIGSTMLQHLLGIDQDEIGREILGAIGIGSGAAPSSAAVAGGPPSAAAAPAAAQTAAAPVTTAAASAPSAPGVSAVAQAQGWSPAQLAAYGVSQTASGVLTRGSVTGADVLNGLELARVAPPAASSVASLATQPAG